MGWNGIGYAIPFPGGRLLPRTTDIDSEHKKKEGRVLYRLRSARKGRTVQQLNDSLEWQVGARAVLGRLQKRLLVHCVDDIWFHGPPSAEQEAASRLNNSVGSLVRIAIPNVGPEGWFRSEVVERVASTTSLSLGAVNLSLDLILGAEDSPIRLSNGRIFKSSTHEPPIVPELAIIAPTESEEPEELELAIIAPTESEEPEELDPDPEMEEVDPGPEHHPGGNRDVVLAWKESLNDIAKSALSVNDIDTLVSALDGR